MLKLTVLILLVNFQVKADEGMWTLDHLPKAQIKSSTGVEITDGWIDHVMKSSVRLANGCSGSFVSGSGLVMTNHHCVRDCIYKLSTQKNNYLDSGFLSASQTQEKQCPAFEVNRLVEIKDVTAEVRKELSGLSGEAYGRAKKKVSAHLESTCTQNKEKERCDLVELYRGGEFHLYRYQRYQDVRLVFAPEAAMGHFGGDPDNFNFPRYSFDVSFLRVYENNAPLINDHFFKWSKRPLEKGEASFITGHPGSTQRLLTVSQLVHMRDHTLPSILLNLSEMRGQLQQFQKLGKNQERIASSKLARIENGLKALKGRVQALRDPHFFNQILKKENELRRQVSKNPWKKNKYGNPWHDIESAMVQFRNQEEELNYVGVGVFDSELFSYARALLRYHAEIKKPNGERLAEYTDSRLPSLKQSLLSVAPVYKELEELNLEFGFTKMREILSPDHPFVRKVLGKDSPAQLAKKLLNGTKLFEKSEREKLLNSDLATLEKSKDSMIMLARLVDADSRSVRLNYEEKIEPVINQASEKIAKIQFDTFGKSTYPDATFSLRLSYGHVKGWEENGHQVPAQTFLKGLYERATGSDPFALPSSWLRARNQVNLGTGFNFASTNDIIGGNSGSPVLNKNTEVMGLVFDGNIHSLGGAYAFDSVLNRAVSLDANMIREALEEVYGAKRISNELLGVQ